MRLPFYKYSPMGNMTILVLLSKDQKFFATDRAKMAAEIISPNHLGAEQAGFVHLDETPPRMEMMGGEFCVNATLALAALLLHKQKLLRWEEKPAGWGSGQVKVSGIDKPITVLATKEKYGVLSSLHMQRPKNVEKVDDGIFLVWLPGISHLVIDKKIHPLPTIGKWENEIQKLLGKYSLLDEEASGCVWLSQENNQSQITPFVRVRDTNTICPETACGSGSLAAALVLAEDQKNPSGQIIMQPCGAAMGIQLTEEFAWITGTVKLIANGDLFVTC